MKKVYVLLAALLMGATAMVQASPADSKDINTALVSFTGVNTTSYGTQQVHRKPMHHKRHHRKHHKMHHVVHH